MPPFCISLTGADDQVNPADLVALHADYPEVEFGILIYAGREGRPRYPTRAWIDRFLELAPALPKALHVCGDSIPVLLEGDHDLLALAGHFGRVQLNVRQMVPGLADRINAFGASYNGIVISQHHAAVENLWREINLPRYQMLMDGSAGTGTLPAQWDPPPTGYVCGFAGGLTPENIAIQFPLIRAAAGDATYWIDLECGLRSSDNCFEMSRVRSFVEQVRLHSAVRTDLQKKIQSSQ